MPNQRKKGKAFIGGYIPQGLADAFKVAAEARGMTARDLLEQLIREDLNSKKGSDNEYARQSVDNV